MNQTFPLPLVDTATLTATVTDANDNLVRCFFDADWPRSSLVGAFDQALPVYTDQEEQAGHHEEQRARLGNARDTP